MMKCKFVGISLFLLLGLILPSNANDMYGQGSTQTTQVRVSSGNDDAEEQYGRVNLSSNDLEMAVNKNRPQVVGMRFRNVQIPPNAVIQSAYLIFMADSSHSGTTNLVIHGDKNNNALPFNRKNISSRAKTSAQTNWNRIPSWRENSVYFSPNISNVVNEIVECNNWRSGNSMAFIVSGNGKRAAKSYNRGNGTSAPVLHITWRYPTADENDCSGE